MGRESRQHLGAGDVHPIEARIARLEGIIEQFADMLGFVMQTARATVVPPGSKLALEPPKPVQMSLLELYREIKQQNLKLVDTPAPAATEQSAEAAM